MRSLRFGFILPTLIALALPIASQNTTEQDPLKRPLNEQEKRQHQKELIKEDKHYRAWENQDVKWIMTDAEREAFARLSNNDERDAFIEAFWDRRDPTPDTVENEFKDEHYRRLTYANEHFSAGTAGSLTDRGHIYIAWGPPDEIESHPSGGIYNREPREGGGSTTTYPFERWRYRHLEGVGTEVVLEFVDACMCNQYKLTIDPEEKDALRNVPGNTVANDRLNLDPGKQFDRLDLLRKVNSTPPVRFTDLAARVNTTIRLNPLAFDVHTDFVRVTGDTVLVPVTVQLRNRDLTFLNKDGVQRGTVNIYGRVTTITGKIVQTFEDTVRVDVPADLLPRTLENVSLYWKALPLPPKMYRLDIVVKDVSGDRYGVYGKSLNVPDYSGDKLACSSLALADVMQNVGRHDIGSGNFVIGMTKVRPRVEGSDGTPARFKRSEHLNLWMQVYNLGLDSKTHRPDATIEYSVINQQTGKQVWSLTESTAEYRNPGDQITLQKKLAMQSLEPGIYQFKVSVHDGVTRHSIAPTTRFIVE